MIERQTRRNNTPRTTPEEPSRSSRRSKLPVPCAATGALRKRVTIVENGYHVECGASNHATVEEHGVRRYDGEVGATGGLVVRGRPRVGRLRGQRRGSERALASARFAHRL